MQLYAILLCNTLEGVILLPALVKSRYMGDVSKPTVKIRKASVFIGCMP
jgi:hypothetical protein